MNKFKRYLGFHHSWQKINCLTLLELIYKEQLNIDFSDMWKRIGVNNGTENVDKNWAKKYGTTIFLNELKYWKKVSLIELEEYDILAFTSKHNKPYHFGLYISNNYFIHIHEKCTSQISLLNDDYREKLTYPDTDGGAYRYVVQ